MVRTWGFIGGVFVGWLVAVAPGTALGQVPFNPATRTPLTLVRFEINGGKLQVMARHAGRTQSAFQSNNRDRTERMTVVLTGGEPRIDYLLMTPTQRVTIVVGSKANFYVRQEPLLGDTKVLPLNFNQSPEGPLTLQWGSGNAKGELQAPTLWHLCLEEPTICRDHLLPLIELLKPGWKLAETVDAITENLLEIAASDQSTSRQQWHALVADLGDESYSRRQSADRKLRAAGPSVRAFLENYNKASLDAEQRWRVRQILRVLAKRSDSDSPKALAEWLSSDPKVWLAMLDDDDPARRERARQELSRILEEPVDFEPLAPPGERQTQLKALRKRVGEFGSGRPTEGITKGQ